jgi:hypothetical protein
MATLLTTPAASTEEVANRELIPAWSPPQSLTRDDFHHAAGRDPAAAGGTGTATELVPLGLVITTASGTS